MNLFSNIVPQILDWWKNLSFGTFLILITSSIVQIIDKYIYPLFGYFYLTPNQLLKGEVWRLGTATFISGSLVEIFCLWFLIQLVTLKIENIVGSAFFLLDFFFKSCLIQIFSIIISFSFSFYDTSYFYEKTYGILPMLIYYYCSVYAAQPYANTRFLGLQISNYKLLFSISVISYLLTASIAIFPTLLIVFVEQFYFDGMLFRISPEKLDKFESLSLFSQFTNFLSYKKRKQSFKEPIQYQLDNPNSTSGSFEQFQGKPIIIGTDEEVAAKKMSGTDYLELSSQ